MDDDATVDERLEAGWRPAQSVPRMWVRRYVWQPGRVQIGEDLVEDLSGAELELMTEAQEAELIERRWTDG